MKGQVRIDPQTFLPGQLTIASLDDQGRVRTVVEGGGGGGDASAANQLTQIANQEIGNDALVAIQTAVESLDTKSPQNLYVQGLEVSASVPVPVAVVNNVGVTDNGGSLTVDGTVGVTGIAPAAALSDTLTNPTVGALGAYELGWNGAQWSRKRVDTSGRSVTVGAAAAGASIAGNPVWMAGNEGGGTVRGLLVDNTGKLQTAVISTYTAPLFTADIRGSKRYAGVPPGGINAPSEIPGYAHPACGFFIVAGTSITIIQPLGTTVTYDVSPGYYWPDLAIQNVLDTSILTDFYLLWR